METMDNTESATIINKITTISDLPNELTLKIFTLLSVHNLCTVERVCKHFQRLANDSSLWSAHLFRRYKKPLEYFKYTTPSLANNNYSNNNNNNNNTSWKNVYGEQHAIHKRWQTGRGSYYETHALLDESEWVAGMFHTGANELGIVGFVPSLFAFRLLFFEEDSMSSGASSMSASGRPYGLKSVRDHGDLEEREEEGYEDFDDYRSDMEVERGRYSTSSLRQKYPSSSSYNRSPGYSRKPLSSSRSRLLSNTNNNAVPTKSGLRKVWERYIMTDSASPLPLSHTSTASSTSSSVSSSSSNVLTSSPPNNNTTSNNNNIPNIGKHGLWVGRLANQTFFAVAPTEQNYIHLWRISPDALQHGNIIVPTGLSASSLTSISSSPSLFGNDGTDNEDDFNDSDPNANFISTRPHRDYVLDSRRRRRLSGQSHSRSRSRSRSVSASSSITSLANLPQPPLSPGTHTRSLSNTLTTSAAADSFSSLFISPQQQQQSQVQQQLQFVPPAVVPTPANINTTSTTSSTPAISTKSILANGLNSINSVDEDFYLIPDATKHIISIAINPSTMKLACGTRENELLYTDLESGKLISTMTFGNQTSMTSPSTLFGLGNTSSLFHLNNPLSPTNVPTSSQGFFTQIQIVDSNMIVSGGKKTVDIWDVRVANQKRLLGLKHKDTVVAVQWEGSEDSNSISNTIGNYIFSASYDHSVKIWDTRTFKCLHTIPFRSGSPTSLHYNHHRLIVNCHGLHVFDPKTFELSYVLESAKADFLVASEWDQSIYCSPGFTNKVVKWCFGNSASGNNGQSYGMAHGNDGYEFCEMETWPSGSGRIRRASSESLSSTGSSSPSVTSSSAWSVGGGNGARRSHGMDYFGVDG